MRCLELDVHTVKCPNGVSNKELYIYSIIIETTYTRLGAVHIYKEDQTLSKQSFHVYEFFDGWNKRQQSFKNLFDTCFGASFSFRHVVYILAR